MPTEETEPNGKAATQIAALLVVAEQIAQVVEQLRRIANALEEANRTKGNSTA
jgi:hypothetical protein